MRFYAGLDLGQREDYSALTILERVEHGAEHRYDCRHVERFALGTSYPRIVAAVGALLDRPPLRKDCELVIDHTGVGVAVADMFTEAGRAYIGVTITGGVGWHKERAKQWHVSKHLLVSTVQKFLSSEALGISKHFHAAEMLRAELRHFRVKISKAANEIYEAREGQHDDLVLSLAVGLFVAEHPSPWTWEPVWGTPAPQEPRRAIVPTSFLINR
jgi:hypothetical protein